jgi:predicted acetyltransferase
VLATPSERDALARLLQLYQYDFGEIEGGDLDQHGLYRYLDPDVYWSGVGWRPFLFKVDGLWAGFGIVREIAPGNCRLEEFFVLRRHRGQGVGEAAARELFDRFPGRWELSQTANNHAARAFWRKVIGRYTGGRFSEELHPENRYRASVHAFEGPPAE